MIPPGEHIVETKVCPVSGEEFHITDKDLEFYDKISPIFGSEKYSIPSPTLCPDERSRRRISWRNDRHFYSRKCDATGKALISSFSLDTGFPIYEHKYWWSDEWSALGYGRDIDFNRTFVDQFMDLYAVVPQLPMINDNGTGSENCEYCYDFARGKDCYFAIGMWQARDCLYSTMCDGADRAIDCELVPGAKLSYECYYSQDLHGCIFLGTSHNCTDCWFGFDLVGCRDCLFCAGLRQKQYCIFNRQLSREEYEQKKDELNTGSYKQLESMKKRWEEFIAPFPRRPVFQVKVEDSTGDMLFNTNNVHNCHCIYNARDCRYFIRGDSPDNSYDIFNCGKSHWSYEGLTPDNSYNALFTTWCWECKDIYYSDNCHGCHDVFGSIGLRQQHNAILNQGYSKQEYEQKCAQLVDHMRSTGEWGEFFPIERSPFPYNDSVAQDYFPETQEAVQGRGWKWSSAEKRGGQAGPPIPDDIQEVGLDILEETLVCTSTGRPYKVQRNELGIYKSLNIPIPRTHHDHRRSLRLQKRNSHQLFLRTCQKCAEGIHTIYSPDRPEVVYCEWCYQEYINQFN